MSAPPERAAGEGSVARRPRYEVADVVRAHGAEMLGASGRERQVLRAIGSCRTAVLGGHVEACRGCGYERIAYNSCRNRHCPKCQGAERARWMAGERAMLLPVSYFHVVFALPDVLRGLVRGNRRQLCDLLFRAAAATLREFARDPKHLGAEPAITMVLHTWGQTLCEHFHVHCVVSGGGLTADGEHWRSVKRRLRAFLFPVRALSVVFRGKYLAGLEELRSRGALRLDAPPGDASGWRRFAAGLRSRPWVVYAKPPFGGPERVLKYLSRYTHRVAISNRRLTYVGGGEVRFAYKDYADGSRTKEMTLAGAEFLRRFLLHVLPKGFMRIRHYGLLANCQRRAKLARARAALAALPEREAIGQERAGSPASREVASASVRTCPTCGQELAIISLPVIVRPRVLDSS